MRLCSIAALLIMSGASGNCQPSPVRECQRGESGSRESLRGLAMFSRELIPESSPLTLEASGMPRLNTSLTELPEEQKEGR